MNEIPLPRLLDTAVRAARAAGNHAIGNKQRRKETHKAFAHDVKLVLDMECQRIAEELILSEFPGHGILGEEKCRPNPDEEYEWIIDPIDGTVNFTSGFPYWCASVAVRRGKRLLAGCVFAPEFNQCYSAHIEEPARLNGRPIRVSSTDRLDEAVVFTGISKYVDTQPERHLGAFRELVLGTRKVRINGSAALDICNVAAGNCDGYFESGIYLWDHAAAGVVARQAGAVHTVFPLDGEPHACGIVCTNRSLTGELCTLYDRNF